LYVCNEIINQNNKTMTTENNKLIAEFMGGYTPYERFGDSTEYYYRGHYVTLENMKFQTSWDWLIPVIQKVNEVSGYNDYNTDRLHIQKVLDDCINENAVGIDSVHKAVVEFIKEYNN